MTPTFEDLVASLSLLPGVGQRTAQRMAMYLLQRNRLAMQVLADALKAADGSIGLCSRCRTFSEQELCAWCSDANRDRSQLCIVETPADQLAIEQHGGYRGQYFVLHGYLSPLDRIGPEQLELSQVEALCRSGADQNPDTDQATSGRSADSVKEVILATNTTVEGEATAYYVAEMLKPYNIQITRIASGVPVGGEIEYLDGNTLQLALDSRRPFRL
ncbi:MAG: recombination mediator RecR [Gammaproteobacteria bacterium]